MRKTFWIVVSDSKLIDTLIKANDPISRAILRLLFKLMVASKLFYIEEWLIDNIEDVCGPGRQYRNLLHPFSNWTVCTKHFGKLLPIWNWLPHQIKLMIPCHMLFSTRYLGTWLPIIYIYSYFIWSDISYLILLGMTNYKFESCKLKRKQNVSYAMCAVLYDAKSWISTTTWQIIW